MKIYVIRHGETEANKNKILMGQRINDSLNEEGKRQAEELTVKLIKDFGNFDLIFTSPLLRAWETAKIINKHLNIPVVIKEELKERDYGSLSGKTWEQVEQETGEGLKSKDRKLEYDYRLYGGESVEQAKMRVRQFLLEVKNNYSNKKVLVVGHGGVIKILDFLSYGERTLQRIENAGIFEFEI